MAKHRTEDAEPDADQRPSPDPRPGFVIEGGQTRLIVTPLTEGETTRVMLTDDNRVVLTERYIPTDQYGFRIFVDGRHFEQVGVSPESGTTIFAPTR